MPAGLIGSGALSELAYETSRRCRCGTLLLYRAPGLRGSGFRIMDLNCGGAMGIRTPDLLHAIQRQPVHPCVSAQVTVLPRPLRSARVQACCGTFLLYCRRTANRTSHAPSRRVTSQNLPICYCLRFLHNQASDRGPRASESHASWGRRTAGPHPRFSARTITCATSRRRIVGNRSADPCQGARPWYNRICIS
jgi:hypothetical protein